jgi:hypothetical protein
MSNNNSYMTVQGPDYGQGLMNWSQLGQMGGAAPVSKTPVQAQAGASTPGSIIPPTQGQAGAGAPSPVAPPTQAQQQMQGLGQRLLQMFGGGSPNAAGTAGASPSIGNPTSLAPQQPAPQPSPPVNPASPYGLY